MANIDQAKRTELARLDSVESQAWADPKPGRKLVITTEYQPGDPHFLEIVLRVVNKRCQILSLETPLEARITGKLSIDDIRQIMDAAGEEDDDRADVH